MSLVSSGTAGQGPKPYRHDDYEYLKRILTTLRNYQSDSINYLSYRQRILSESSDSQKECLLSSGFGDYLENIMNCIDANQLILDDIHKCAEEVGVDEDSEKAGASSGVYRADSQRLHELLRQIVREWSSFGKREREESFGVMLNQLTELYPPESRGNIRVLVPGSGLGRLAFEAACLGFDVLANDQSLLMLLTSNFILNKCSRPNNYRVYPFIHDLKNRLHIRDITTPISFPDVDPRAKNSQLSLDFVQGDFLEVCTPQALESPVDCVLTSFFLDSAKNILDFVELIARILPEGGHWINLGPLNYAYSRISSEIRAELSWNFVRPFIQASGFVFVKESSDLDCGYCYDPSSMGNPRFKCLNFVCKKVASSAVKS